ncbi:MAG: hypothetical protein NT013_16380 [Planctomycetia bacterium]|nr:hypothetical protein [Planctomycetia bacterium]
MAFCPKCNGTMEATAIECPHCGYDSSESYQREPEPAGFAYSRLAELALVVASVVTGCGCVLSAYFCFASLFFERHWMNGLVWYPIAFLYQFAMLVVFIRIQHK